MDSKTYWVYVARAEEKLKEDHQLRTVAFRESGSESSWEGQSPTGLELFLTSVENYDKGTSEGTVYVLHRRLAAQRIVEGTHRVSTAAEIKAHHTRLEKNRREADLNEIKRNRSYVTQVPHTSAGVDVSSPDVAAAIQAAVKAAVDEILGGSKEAAKPKGAK